MRLDLKIEALKKEEKVFFSRKKQEHSFLNGMGGVFSSSEGNVFFFGILF